MNENENYQNQGGGAYNSPQTGGNPYQDASYGQYSGDQYGNQQYHNNQYGGTYQNYQAPYQPSQLDLEEPVKTGEWIVTILITLIPCVNIIMMFVWAFSQTEKKSKSNFFKASLILFGIIFVLYLVCIFALVALVGVSLY